MNQAKNTLEKLFEEGSGDYKCGFNDGKEYQKISSLTSDTQWIDTLQRYHQDEGCEVCKDKLGDYVLYDDLVELLRS